MANVPAIFVADQASTVLTPTSIGSLNNGTSPTLPFGFNANYESATITNITGGSFQFDLPTDSSVLMLLFHDNSLSASQLVSDIAQAAWPPELQISMQVYTTAGSPSAINIAQHINGVAQTPIYITPADPAKSSLLINGSTLTIEGHSIPFDTTKNALTLIDVQPVTSLASAKVDTLNFVNNLYQVVMAPPEIISYRLYVLQQLTAWLQGITPANGYAFDLSKSVYRGRAIFGASDSVPMVSVLESPRPAQAILAGDEGFMRKEDWHLLIQGWVQDDPTNPTDPVYALVAAVEQRLGAIIAVRQDGSGLPANPAIYRLGANPNGVGTLITDLKYGPPVVRPPTEQVSSKAFFYLPVYIGLAAAATAPYITV